MFLKTTILCLAASFVASGQNDGKDLDSPTDKIATENPKTSSQSPVTNGSDNWVWKLPSNDSCICTPHWLCKSIYEDKEDVTEYEEEESYDDEESCPEEADVCCKTSKIIDQESITPTPPTSKDIRCGHRNPKGLGSNTTEGKDTEAKYGEFPWMVSVHNIEEDPQKLNVYRCGGSLIHPEVVLTAAHCVAYPNKPFKIRAGDWAARNEAEMFPHQDREVSSVVVHPKFNGQALNNDIALLFLKTPVTIAENVDVVCLPPKNPVIKQTQCLASGWSRDVFGKDDAGIPKKIVLPLVDRSDCQYYLRITRFGSRILLHGSFICAGADEAGRGVCRAAGGSSLVCPIEGREDRYAQFGLVSWGIGKCGDTGTPTVYTNVGLFRGWIDEQMALKNLDSELYQY